MSLSFYKSVVALAALPLTLAGCSSSSVTPDGPDIVTPAPLFPLASGTTTTVNGVGRQAKYSYDMSGGASDGQITLQSMTEPEAVTAEATTDASGLITSGSIKTKNTYLGMSDFYAEDGYIMAEDDNDTAAVAFADPTNAATKYTYQTFGIWSTIDRSAGEVSVGAYSVGNETATTGLPTTGTATFAGRSGALFDAGDMEDGEVFSNVTLNADFANRSVNFSTVADSTDQSHLNMTGSMSYAASSNSMSGNVTTAGNSDYAPLSGTVDGRFYGPGAEEVGGSYSLKSDDAVLIGAYGAKR